MTRSRPRSAPPGRVLWVLWVLHLAACLPAPKIVVVDRATALEQQAAGSFKEIESRLVRAGLVARPVPLTPEDLAALGVRPPPLADEIDLTDADRLDALLVERCVGEARDGTLVDTYDSCRGAEDREVARALIDRANRARQQLWHWMQARQKPATIHELRRAWRQAHLRGVICGGWVQGENGTWEAKKC